MFEKAFEETREHIVISYRVFGLTVYRVKIEAHLAHSYSRLIA